MFYEASRKKKKGDVAEDDEDNGKTDWTMYEYENFASQAQLDAKRKGGGKVGTSIFMSGYYIGLWYG